jgi:ATP-dependent exoDNAse (exonuclease V) beta subunit
VNRAPEATVDPREGDRAARLEAQRRFDRPLVLEAGAGTGKTTTLIARLLAWCLGPGWAGALARQTARAVARPGQREIEIAPERVAAAVLAGVVAITFTEAAAAEMAARTARELAGLAAGDDAGDLPDWLDGALLPPAGERALRARALLATLDHLSVRTIHAFCLGLLAEHPLEAGVHPDLTVDADGRLVEEAVREAVEAALRDGYGDPGDPDLLALAVVGIGPREIVEALAQLAAAGLPAAALAADPLAPAAVAALRARLAAACAAVHALLAPRLGGSRARNALALAGAMAALAGRLEEEAAVDVGALQGWVEELLPENLLAHLRKWGKEDWSGTEASLFGEARLDLAARAAALCRLLDHLARLDPGRLGAAHRALAPLLATVERELRARGVATFDALLAGAERFLAANPGERARVRRGIDQLLVDEFQDTDRVQCEILRWLALDGPPAERPGLFLVGDPKQSIYGWRSADLRAYDGFVARVRRAGGEVMSLRENFRSVPAILDEVARVVAPAMRERPGLQPPFVPLLACERRSADPGFRRAAAGPDPARGPVEHWVSWQPGERRRPRTSEAAELEAAAVAADVRALHDRAGVAWRDVAVLLRGLGDLDVYLDALRRAGVPFAVGRDKQYYRRREVIEAAALVRAVLDPGDHLALLTVLRSSLAGVPDAALVPLWARDFPRRMTELLAPDAARLAELYRVIEEAAREVPRDVPGIERVRGWEKNLLVAVEHLAVLRRSFATESADVFVEALRGLTLVEAVEAARYLGPYRLANLDRFFRQLLAAIEEGGGDMGAVLRALRTSVAEARDAEEGRPREGDPDAVPVLTIHGAKGLDFRHVYLVQLHHGQGGDRGPRTEVGRGEEGGFEYRLFGLPTPGFDLVEAERREVEAAERVRTLYVAMTRAKDRLVLAGSWPDERAPRPPEQARHHLDLLLHRPHVPDLAALWQEAAAGDGWCFPDAAGALWKFPSLRPEVEDDAGAAPVGPPLPGPREIARDAALLRDLRAAAAARAARPFSAAASEEAHAQLREQQAERRLESGGADADPAPGDREAAMAAGAAVHRALETWDLAAAPHQEAARQRDRLSAYLATVVRGGDLDAALPRARDLLDRLAGSALLARLRSLRAHVLARELPVLLPPGEGETAPVGFVAGAIDLLYRDPATGRLVIADYKTDEVESPEALTRRAAAYAPQGAAYVRALHEALALAEPPRFELWFLRADRVEVVGS